MHIQELVIRQLALLKKTALDGVGAVACSSGMANVTMLLLDILRSGNDIIAGSGIFGETIDLLDDLKSLLRLIILHLKTILIVNCQRNILMATVRQSLI